MIAVGKKIILELKIIEKEVGGILLPESISKDVELYIHKLGSEVDNKIFDIGNRVVVNQSKAIPLKVKDKEYLVVESSDILVIL